MDDWRKVVRWAAQHSAQERARQADDRPWITVCIFTVIFGGICFAALEPASAGFASAMIFFALTVALNA